MKSKLRTKIISGSLAVLLVLQIVPIDIMSFANNRSNPYDIATYYQDIAYFNDKVFEQIDYDAVETYKETKDGLTNYHNVSASFGIGYSNWSTTNVNIDTNGYFNTNLNPPNLSPVTRIYATDTSKSWSAEFGEPRAIGADPEATLVFGCTFYGQSGTLKLGNEKSVSASGMLSKQVSEKLGNLDTTHVTVSGAGSTQAKGFYAYVRDNNPAEIESVEYSQDGSTLIITATANEDLTFATRDAAEKYKDNFAVEVSITNARTGANSQKLTAYLSYLSGKTMQFKADLGEMANEDFYINEIKASTYFNNPSISYEGGVPMYDLRKGYTYYDYDARKYVTVSNGFKQRTTKPIDITSTVITDVARNGLDISDLSKSYSENKKPFFDNTNPRISDIFISVKDNSSDEKTLYTELSEESESWPEEISLKDLYTSVGETIIFTVVLDEKLEKSNIKDVKLYLNMQDDDGKQIVLSNPQIENTDGGPNGNPHTELYFMYTIPSQDVSMIKGDEGKRIRPVNLTYGKLEDAAGHKLQLPDSFPAPAQQLYLDVSEPTVTVEQLETEPNSGSIDVKITVSDTGVGILEQPLSLSLYADSQASLLADYTIETLNGNKPEASGQVTVTSNETLLASVTMLAKNEYTAYLRIRIDGAQTMDSMSVEINGVSDLLGNKSKEIKVDLDAKYDKVAPTVNINALKVSYETDKANIEGKFDVSDYNEIPVKQYVWKTVSGTNGIVAPAVSENEWKTAAANSTNVTYTVENNENQTVFFFVRAQDEFGNWSETKYSSIEVLLEKPSTSVENLTQSDKPLYNPDVIVSGSAKSKDGIAAQTRVTVTMGGKKYVRTVSTGESTDIFDFDGKWYQVVDDGTKFTSVTELADTTALKNYYGEVSISFENCYGNLTPVVNGTLIPANNGTYYKDPQVITVLYAPVQPDGVSVHNVTFGNITDSVGNVITKPSGAKAHHFTSEMTGTKFNFSISNSLNGEWGINDVDYAKSYIVFEKVDNDGNVLEEKVKFTGISNGKDQTFTVPGADADGEAFTVGAYRLKVGIYKNGSNVPEEFIDTSNIIVLDIGQAVTPYLWEYKLYTDEVFGGGDIVVTAAEEGEITSLGLSYSMPYRNIYRDREFATYTSGVDSFYISVGSVSEAETYYGITVNEIAGIRIWNKASNPTKEELANLPFHSADYTMDTEKGTVAHRLFTNYELVESVPSLSEGKSEFCLIKDAVNTFYCQTKYANGTVSAISEFSVYLTDKVPELDVSVDSYVPSLVKSDIEDQINAESVTYKINGVYSEIAGEDIRLKLIHSGEYNEKLEIKVNGESYTGTGYVETEVEVGDLITVSKDCYSNQLSNSSSINIKLVTTKIVAVDAFGASVCVIPQLGEENRDGYYTSDEYAVSSEEFWSDPWNEDAAERYYVNGSEYGTKYVSYRYYNSNDEMEILTTSDENLSYNKYNIEIVEAELDEFSDYVYGNESNRITAHSYYNSNNTIDAFDWETATIEISGDGIDGTVVLPYQAEAPNAAGLVEFDASYGSLYLEFAHPVTDDQSITEYNRTYTIKVKDNAGNDHAFTQNYTNKAIYYNKPENEDSLVYGDDLVYSEEHSDQDGVSLYMLPYNIGGSQSVPTNMFSDGLYRFVFTDAYGKEWPISYDIYGTAFTIAIVPSETDYTVEPVSVKITSFDPEYLINIERWNCSCGTGNCDCFTVENNGTTEVTVTARKNGVFYFNDGGEYYIDNIIEASYSVQWDIPQELVENGGEYRGPATAYLQPAEMNPDDYYYEVDEYYLIDRITGTVPSFTFYPGEETTYTFKADELAYVLGDKEYVFTEDVTVELPVTLLEVEQTIITDEQGNEVVDGAGPEVQLAAYIEQKGFFLETGKVLQVLHSEETLFEVNPDYEIFKANTPTADAEEFIDAIGWGTGFRFNISTLDMSDVKLFVKQGVNTEAPDYENGISDEIEGVSISGSRLKVSSAAVFTLFAVDSENNSTAIYLDLSNIGAAPVPVTVKVPVDGEVRIYLTEPEFTDGESAGELKIVSVGYDVFTDEDPSSEYCGYDYITVDRNGDYSLSYSYLYYFETGKEPQEVNGIVTTRVFEIRNDPIMLSGQISWSANVNDAATNKSITAKMKFTQNVTSVQAPAEYVDMIDVLINGTEVSVRYDDNAPAISLRIMGANATETVVDLSEVANIDKVAPIVSLVSKTISENGREATVILSSNEKATLTKHSNQGEKSDDKYLYTDTVKANGTYTYTFVDTAGNFTALETQVSGIIDTDLVLEYSLDGTEEGTVTDPLELELDLGDSIYVRVNREAKIDMNGEQAVDAAEKQWIQLTVKAGMEGLWPIIRAEDAYGNVVLGQLGQVTIPDTTAPVVDLIKDIIIVKVGTDAAEVEKLLTENVVAYDLDPNLTVNAEYTADLSVPGAVQVTYTVSDSSNNTGTDTGVLRIASNSEPEVKINGEIVPRDTIYLADADEEIKLTVETQGEPYSVVYKNGIKSSGQMKIGVTDVVTDAVKADEIILPFSENGCYTVCIKTQSRDYYIFNVYTE